MKKIISTMMMLVLCLLCVGNRAAAAGNAAVSITGTDPAAGTSSWKVTCEISGDTQVTNGKIRITYDSSQLKLVSASEGAFLQGTLPSINDPVNGTKEEGEILAVFASANAVAADGTVVDMEFALRDQVKEGDKIKISVSTEELMNNSDNVTVTDTPLTVTVGGQTGSSDSQTGTTDNKTAQTEAQNTEDQENDDGYTQDGNGSSNGSSDASGTTDTASSGTQSTGVTPVKTGDPTDIIFPVVMAVAALGVLIGGFVWKKKK